jgi:hypothetical protein
MLKRCGVENVICFSYGRHGNDESEASRAVADALGYKWYFYPYDGMSWQKWFQEKQMGKYIDYASNCCTLAHLQDWPAVRELLHNIPADRAVFMPGLCFDMLSDIHLVPSQLLHSKEDTAYDTLLTEAILSDNYHFWPWYRSIPELKSLFVERIMELLPTFSSDDKAAAIDAYETWFFEARPCKFVINSVRIYEFFGCQWMLPWWDYELMDFFLRIKNHLRIGRKLCGNTLLNRIYIDDLDKLARIPFVGTPLTASKSQKAEHRLSYAALHTLVYQGLKKAAPNFIRNIFAYYQGGNPLGIHGVYFEAGRPKKLEAVISSVDLPSIVKQILRPNAKNPVTRYPANGVFAIPNIGRIRDLGIR